MLKKYYPSQAHESIKRTHNSGDKMVSFYTHTHVSCSSFIWYLYSVKTVCIFCSHLTKLKMYALLCTQ